MTSNGKRYTRIYTLILLFVTLTGFAQMPIFKRYYIADIPGLGWLAEFYVTHVLHYASAAILMAFAAYVAMDFLLNRYRRGHISRTGYVKLILLSGLMVSGALMVIKNLSDMYFPHTAIILLDLFHLGFCMLLLVMSLYSLVFKVQWVRLEKNS
jgi:hypothetical protein